MFSADLLIAFAFMALLFLRQIAILKQPNKLNYSPLMIGIGAIASLVHFIIHPDSSNLLLLIRESIFPLLVALLLYLVMNIMHQTQLSQNARTQEEFTRVLVDELSALKSFILEIEEKMIHSQELERSSQAEIREKFKKDIAALESIQMNQMKFIEKFDEMDQWHKNVSKGLEYFTDVQLPQLDNVVHEHIDILRVAEQDHYNKLTALLERAVESRGDISEDIEGLKESITSMKSLSKDVADSITKHTLEQLSGVTKAFESQIVTLKSHSEAITTALHESENRLGTIRSQSEIIMKQMVLSSSKMESLQKENKSLQDVYVTLKQLIEDVEAVKIDYIKNQTELSAIVKSLQSTQERQLGYVHQEVERLENALESKLEVFVQRLEEQQSKHSESTKAQSMELIAKQLQFKNGYAQNIQSED